MKILSTIEKLKSNCRKNMRLRVTINNSCTTPLISVHVGRTTRTAKQCKTQHRSRVWKYSINPLCTLWGGTSISRIWKDGDFQNAFSKGYRTWSKKWAAHLIFAPEKDWALRFCVDYRKLGTASKRDPYPIPRMNECTDSREKTAGFLPSTLAEAPDKIYWTDRLR